MKAEATSIYDYFGEVYTSFQKSGVQNPLLETQNLFDLLSGGMSTSIDVRTLEHGNVNFNDLVKKRTEKIPLEYIIGMASFMGRIFCCHPGTFIPKKQTEILCKVAIEYIKREKKFLNRLNIIDMCTGCGNIAITLALNLGDSTIYGLDIDPAAIETAKTNVDMYGLGEKVILSCGDLFTPLKNLEYEEKIDCVVCNPPYIPTGSLRKLSPEIIDHEPRIALDGGPYGISFYRRLIHDTLSILKPKGLLIMEIGRGQEELVARMLKGKKHYENIQYHGEGKEIRVVSAVKK
jgi:release factor glutamine methyltransferase